MSYKYDTWLRKSVLSLIAKGFNDQMIDSCNYNDQGLRRLEVFGNEVQFSWMLAETLTTQKLQDLPLRPGEVWQRQGLD